MKRRLSTRGWLTCYGLMSAAAYATLLPLWEGYDEPFHYAYVQQLDLTRTFPVLDKTPVRQEIWSSMILAPTSSVNARSNPQYTSYSQYFELPSEERSRRQKALRTLPPQLEGVTGGDNYEAQQAPLAYLAMVPLHRVVSGLPLYPRIWLLRLFAAAISVLLLVYAIYALGSDMRAPEAYQHAAVFCLLSAQSVYGAIAHVANDWLSLPLIPILLLCAGRFWRNATSASAIAVAAVLAAGLLAKSYFLLFLPVVIAIVLWRQWRHAWILAAMLLALAAPWYARNVLLYDSLTGLQAAVRAVPKSAIWATVLSTSWPGALAGMARAGLWSANNSFTTFSAATLNAVLGLLAAGCALWLRWGKRSPEHWILLAGTVLFAVVPLYAMVLFGTMYGQVHPGANSWYTAGMLPGVLLTAFAGFSYSPRFGRLLAGALIALSTYIVITTYFAKLIPIYAGFDSPARAGIIRTLYLQRFEELVSRLGQTAMASGEVVISMAAIVAVFSAFLCWRLLRSL